MQLSYHPSSNLYNTQLSLIDNKHVVVRCIVGLLWIRVLSSYHLDIFFKDQLSKNDDKHVLVNDLDELHYIIDLNT